MSPSFVEPPLTLVGGHPAMDFVNSMLSPQEGVVVDYLKDGAALTSWMSEAAALPKALQDALASMHTAASDALAASVRELREAFRHVLLARVGDLAADVSADLGRINRALARAPMTPQLVDEGGVYSLRVSRGNDVAGAVLAELAAHCADLLALQASDDVRLCENPQCTRWFHDCKRGPRRRWCSMAVCGNRAKAAAHRARGRAAARD